MDFETLIWIVIFLVYILSFILKRKFAASKAGKQPVGKKSPEWKEKLDRFMTQVRTELKTGQTEEPRGNTGWEDLQESREYQEEYQENDAWEYTAVTTEPSDMASGPTPETAGEQAPLSDLQTAGEPVPYGAMEQGQAAPVAQPAPGGAGARRIRPAASRNKPMPFASGLRIRDLKRAVVWSEILAPPIALRDRPERKIG